METNFFTDDERRQLVLLYRQLARSATDAVGAPEVRRLKELLGQAVEAGLLVRDNFGTNPVLRDMETALIVSAEMGMKRASLLGILLHDIVTQGLLTTDQVQAEFGADVAGIIRGLVRTAELYAKSPTVESENFRSLLLSFAEDMRVVLIMIADRVGLMRRIGLSPDDDDRRRVAAEAAYLYAPLAHKLGLYKLKSELEDLSLKYLHRDVYYEIKEKLNETKASRDCYIASFIQPVQAKLEEAGLRFSIKGRTKSIHSIWNKMQKQQCPFEGIYDHFAIRVILDSDPDKEKQECWRVYSIVTDMYQPNPKRLRDWLSIPKSNGYESLHITVLGPEGKWVEVQIRTRRMDEIAERGLAAHWRYKGVKGESGLDEWLTSVREALEHSDGDDRGLMDQFRMDLYDDEVFVFTPRGDLFQLRKGATVLDFAFHIHTKLGCQCVGAKVNGKNAPLRAVLNSGDQVEVMTSSTQTPKQDWLNIVTTSKARTKIRQVLKEAEARQAAYAKEMLERKFKNRKLDYDEALMMRLISRLGCKTVTEFYQRLAEGTLDGAQVIDRYVEMQRRAGEPAPETAARSAEAYNMQAAPAPAERAGKEDVLVIDRNLKGLDYKLAKCCNPIYGDEVFGFVGATGGIKIHRATCPNAPQLMERFGYRILRARWAGKSAGSQYAITLRVVGHDDIGIVTNLTSIINKEEGTLLRNIGIDSDDGLFAGTLTLLVGDTTRLEALIKKLKAVKGVKQVTRI